jgi:hypothetical protein
MPFTVAAIGAGVSAVAGIAGGIMQKNAVDKGASQARDALNQGVTTATNQLSPWSTAGQPALTDQSDLLGLNGQPAADAAMAKFQQSPGYQWQLGEGLRATDAGAAAKGFARSGAALQAEQQFGSGLAATDFGNYWNRLQQLSGSGLDAAKGIASAATGGAQQIANTDIGQAGADASIYGNMAKSIGTSANQLLQTNAVQGYLGGGAGSSGAPQMTGFAPSLQVGQEYTGGFVAQPPRTQGY